MPAAILDRKELRRTDRYIQLALVAAREALDEADLPDRFEGDLAERTGVILGTGLGGVGTLIDGFVDQRRCAAPTGSARSSSRWASRTSAPARSPSSSG